MKMLIKENNISAPVITGQPTESDIYKVCSIPKIDMTDSAVRKFVYMKFCGPDPLYYNKIRYEPDNLITIRHGNRAAEYREKKYAILAYEGEDSVDRIIRGENLNPDEIMTLYPYIRDENFIHFMKDDYYDKNMDNIPIILPEFIFDIHISAKNGDIKIRNKERCDVFRARVRWLFDNNIYVYFISANCELLRKYIYCILY